jgi:RNA polymerase sigma factor for flagellar operon FliA
MKLRGDMKMTAHLLEKYADTKDIELRNEIIENCIPLVKTVVSKVYNKKMSPDYEFGDLVQFGIFGLISAIENYDKNKCDRFTPYAWIRIHGAIIDEMRKLDFVPRATRSKIKLMHQLLQDKGERMTPAIVYNTAREVGLKTRDLHVFYGDYKISLEECVGM